MGSSLTIGSSTRYFDRFGAGLEQGFSKKEINEVVGKASFDVSTLNFTNVEPLWTLRVKKLLLVQLTTQ